MTPSSWNFGPYLPHRFRNANFQSISAHSTSAITPSKNSSVMTNRKSTMGFPMNLKRWTAYVACKPPNGGRVGAEKKAKWQFSVKTCTCLEEMFATKCLYVKTISDRVVRHSLAYLSMQNSCWWMSPSAWKFGQKRPIFKNADFQSILSHNT